MKINGSKIVVESLKAQGVDTVFGYPGGAVIPLYDALYDEPAIKNILPAHEQGASHAADGYARATGKVGVVIATSGPGATNLVTGLATAYMDSVPVVAITGNVPSVLHGKDSFQEVDIVGVTMPITKHNYRITDVEKISDIINEAFEFAQSGRPGPVLIDIPKDIFYKECEYNGEYKSRIVKDEMVLPLEDIVTTISEANKPVIFCGGGVVTSGAEDLLYDFAKKIGAPVACSLMGTGAFPSDDELYMGMVGMHGTMASNMAFTNCDLLIVLGARFSDRVTGNPDEFAKHAKIIQVDIDNSEINKNIATTYYALGDLSEVLSEIYEAVPEKDHSDWIDTVHQWRQQDLEHTDSNHVPKKILEASSKYLGENTLVVTDVGQHQMWTAQYFKFERHDKFLTSGGLGTMGYGFGAAVGAQVGRLDRNVMHFTGDGSFRMNMNEMATAVKYSLPIVTVLFDNNTLGMVRQWQTLFCNSRWSQTDLPPMDFAAIALAYGYKNAWHVNTVEEYENALQEALKGDGPALIQCHIDIDTMVLPIVPPGKALDKIVMTKT